MSRIAFWTPYPPQRSGISDYSYELITQLSSRWDLTVVVDERLLGAAAVAARQKVQVPKGVELIDYSAVGPGAFDCDVYHIGNNAEFHSYIHARALDKPGVLVLHDPSLYDFYVAMCGGPMTRAFIDEAEFDLGKRCSSTLYLGQDVDRLALLMSKRLVEASRTTIVHSEWARSELLKKAPQAVISHLQHPAKILARPHRSEDVVTFGILGGINRHKRVVQALRAFALLHAEYPRTRLRIAGRIDMPALAGELADLVKGFALGEAVDISYDVDGEALDEVLVECDVLIALRWPTAGETSGIVMRGFGAATPVITSDVPQFREFDESYCWRVPLGEHAEQRELLRLMRKVADYPEVTLEAGLRAQAFMRDHATFPIVAERYSRAIEESLERRTTRAVSASALHSHPSVVNAIGCWSASTGLGEAARRAVEALTRAGTSVALTEVDIDVPKDSRRIPMSIQVLPKGRPGRIEICFLNINEMHGVEDAFLRSRRGNYIIAYWYWEMPELPPQLVSEVRRFDEIWVASRFVQANFAKHTTAPIFVMPSGIEPRPNPQISRSDFQLPGDSCLFFFNFDANSGLGRKNPLAVIEAFRRAFPHRDGGRPPLLVMKTTNLHRWPEANFEIRRRLDHVGGVVIDSELAAEEVASLTKSCDVYVSLHRAEGFGLGMAEAMYFGLPVVATRYSGSEEFLTAKNSCGVGYRPRSMGADDLRFNPGAAELYRGRMTWADPDVDQAARWMRLLFERPDLRQSFGQAGAETIRSRYSLDVAGSAMRSRIHEILSDSRGATTHRSLAGIRAS